MEYNTVYIHRFESSALALPQNEILRYMSCGTQTEETQNLIREFLPEVKKVLSCRGSFVYLPLSISGNNVTIGDEHILSSSLSQSLEDCTGALVFSLTCGIGVDMLIAKYSRIRPSAALCINAIATAATESYADEFCREMGDVFLKEGLYIRQRFSPGYGDLSLDYQPLFLKYTNAGTRCGITLTDSLMMTPSKSITAVMGVSKKEKKCTGTCCDICDKTNCEYAKKQKD